MELHAQKNKIKILIIDDEAPIREVLSESLRDDGYEVLVAPDGPSGLQCLKDFKPDVCFLDIWMPKMDGIELVRRLRALPKFKSTPILLLTTESDPEKKKQGKEAGATGWITKPFQPDQLVAAVAKVTAS